MRGPTDPDGDRHPPDLLPAELQVARSALLVGRVEDEVYLAVERLEGGPGEPREHAHALVVRMGGSVDGADRAQHPVAGDEAPAQERAQPDQPPVGFGDEHERRPEGVREVLPAEEFGRPPARRTPAERRVEQLEHFGLIPGRERTDDDRRPDHCRTQVHPPPQPIPALTSLRQQRGNA
jgi:hypothetical protein